MLLMETNQESHEIEPIIKTILLNEFNELGTSLPELAKSSELSEKEITQICKKANSENLIYDEDGNKRLTEKGRKLIRVVLCGGFFDMIHIYISSFYRIQIYIKMQIIILNSKCSIIIPIYNEQDAVVQTIEQINRVMEDTDFQYEIVLVDDGSTDQTADKINDFIGDKYNNIKLIHHREKALYLY